ncbi:MAG: hypothetical protein ACKO81_13425 [Planctomycetota bacterium]
MSRWLWQVAISMLLCSLVAGASQAQDEQASSLRGVAIIPHTIAPEMKYRREREPGLSARFQLFISGPADQFKLAGREPAELLAAKEWAWHDFASGPAVPPGAIGVREFNGATTRWGVGQQFELQADTFKTTVAIEAPQSWVSSVTFLNDDAQQPRPDRIVLYVRNETEQPLQIRGLRLWLPREASEWQTLWPQAAITAETSVPAKELGFLDLRVSPLPLTYAALEVLTEKDSLWTYLRIKKESFDISGGWIGKHLQHDAYLDLLASLHVDTGQIQEVDSYTNDPARYARHPIKSFNRMLPLEKFDTDEWLPKIHAVEFLGEPQYGGGRPVPPQEVWEAFKPYRASRLATSVTHSEERTWRFYSGLSDYPHFDAYRVVAPAADSWRAYDRWDGRSLRWGAPLETIGDLTRSLRDLNRPMPVAAWSQGPHDGWGGFLDGRRRRSPNPDELRSQALHAISSRITSLYWFNLSLEGLLKFPDTWEPMRRLGRELYVLEPILLSGGAYAFERRRTGEGRPDWDLASIVSPAATLLFALDTAYVIDPAVNEFRFAPPRQAEFRFRLPPWQREPKELFRLDADGVSEADWRLDGEHVVISGSFSGDAIFLVGSDTKLRETCLQRLSQARAHEAAHPVELEQLQSLRAK